jgi:hypothetical protein
MLSIKEKIKFILWLVIIFFGAYFIPKATIILSTPFVYKPQTFNVTSGILIETSIFNLNQQVVMRANVSDSENNLKYVWMNLTASNGTLIYNNVLMNNTTISCGTYCWIFEKNYTLATGDPGGNWIINVTANDTNGNTAKNSTTFVVDVPPTYSLNSTNSTLAGTAVSHNLFWQDNVGLSGYIFSFYNGSGVYRTPASVYSFCEEAPLFYANNTIDGDLTTDWESLTSHEHWIVYDLGTSAEISKLRVYTDAPSSGLAPCSINAIYVSNDPSNFGSSLGSCSLTGTDTTWRECSFTKKSGRYIKITLNTTDIYGTTCGYNELAGFYEFQAYTEMINDTWVPFTSSMCLSPYTACWSNVTKVINSTVGATIKWKVYANDTSNNWNESEIFSYITTTLSYLEVNLEFPSSYSITQNQTFTINATVFCRKGACGNVYGTIRYNASSPYPDTPVNTSEGEKPFYIQEPPYPSQALKACPTNPLEENEFCNLTWIINATGDVNSVWKIGVLFNSSEQIQNHTSNSTITIVPAVESLSLSWSSIEFGFLIPNTQAENNPAPGNSNNLYNITNTGTCNLNLWIKGSDLTNSTFNSLIAVGNLSWSNSSSIYNPNTVYPLDYYYKLLYSNLLPNSNLTTYYWLSVPSVYAGIYKGTITICGNCSSICD